MTVGNMTAIPQSKLRMYISSEPVLPGGGSASSSSLAAVDGSSTAVLESGTVSVFSCSAVTDSVMAVADCNNTSVTSSDVVVALVSPVGLQSTEIGKFCDSTMVQQNTNASFGFAAATGVVNDIAQQQQLQQQQVPVMRARIVIEATAPCDSVLDFHSGSEHCSAVVTPAVLAGDFLNARKQFPLTAQLPDCELLIRDNTSHTKLVGKVDNVHPHCSSVLAGLLSNYDSE
jgi:hypothetical protein